MQNRRNHTIWYVEYCSTYDTRPKVGAIVPQRAVLHRLKPSGAQESTSVYLRRPVTTRNVLTDELARAEVESLKSCQLPNSLWDLAWYMR